MIKSNLSDLCYNSCVLHVNNGNITLKFSVFNWKKISTDVFLYRTIQTSLIYNLEKNTLDQSKNPTMHLLKKHTSCLSVYIKFVLSLRDCYW